MSDDPVADYVAAAIATDSIEHFVVMMTPQAQRPVVATAVTLSQVINNIVSQGSEAAIQQLKLNWWLEEIELSKNNKPRHPLTSQLVDAVPAKDWLEPLRLFVIGSLEDIGRGQFKALQDCLAFCHRNAERQAILCAVLPASNDLTLSNARTLGVGICLGGLISGTHSDSPRLVTDPNAASADLAVEKLASIAQSHFDAVEKPPVEAARTQLPLYLLGRLHQRQLERLRKHDFTIHKTRPGPFYLLWQAWREARRLIK